MKSAENSLSVTHAVDESFEATRTSAQAVNNYIYGQPRTIGFLGDASINQDEDGVYITPWILAGAHEPLLPPLPDTISSTR